MLLVTYCQENGKIPSTVCKHERQDEGLQMDIVKQCCEWTVWNSVCL